MDEVESRSRLLWDWRFMVQSCSIWGIYKRHDIRKHSVTLFNRKKEEALCFPVFPMTILLQ